MKKIFFSIFTFIWINSFAQESEFETLSTHRNSIKLSSDYFFASNAINNRFGLGYFKGEFIDDARKNSVSRKLSEHNRFGAGFNTTFKYSHLNDTIFKLPKSWFAVSFSNYYHLNSTFNKDVFELYFRGNKSYAGKKAELGDFTYNQYVYQQLNFTFGHSFKRETNKFSYSAGVSLNKGQKLYRVIAPKASLFTQENGEYLDLDADLKIYQSDSSKNKWIDWTGTGTSIDFSFSWKNAKNSELKINARNFGFIQWNNRTAYVRADTTFRFEGIDVTDLFLFSDSVKETISLDSSFVEPYLSDREKKNYFTPLPALLSLSYRYYLLPDKLYAEAEINYLFFAGYTIQERLKFSYAFTTYHRLAILASYGGYTGIEAGISYNANIANRFELGIGSNYLSGIINPEKGCAQGAFVSLSAYF